MNSETMRRPKLGVVVIGRNEGKRLISCLYSVKSNIRPVVYVDSGSTDGSSEAAQRMDVHVVRLESGQAFTAARARNEGFAELKRLQPDIQFVQFLDGDCDLVPGWIGKAFSFLSQRPEVALVCGRRRERYPENSIYNRLCDLEWNASPGEVAACGGDFLVRANAFESVGGFRSNLIAGEEPELCFRLREHGFKIWRLDAEQSSHDVALTRFGQWWTRVVRSGVGYVDVSCQGAASIYSKNVVSALFWAGALPLVLLVGLIFKPILIFGILAYPVQVCRVARNCKPIFSEHWSYGFFMTLAKFGELQGILVFFWSRLINRPFSIKEYKNV